MIAIKWSLCCREVTTRPNSEGDIQGNLKGVFEGFHSYTAPYQCAAFFVVLGARLSSGEDHLQVVISTRETDAGQVVFSTDPALNHLTVQGNGEIFKIHSIPIKGLILPEFGPYRYQVLVNGSDAHVSSFDFSKKRLR